MLEDMSVILKSIGVMAEEMQSEIADQGQMLAENNRKADDVNDKSQLVIARLQAMLNTNGSPPFLTPFGHPIVLVICFASQMRACMCCLHIHVCVCISTALCIYSARATHSQTKDDYAQSEYCF